MKSPPERNAREIVVVKARQVVASVAKLKFFDGEGGWPLTNRQVEGSKRWGGVS